MDRGILERQEAEKVKQEISQSAQKRKSTWVSGVLPSDLELAERGSMSRGSTSTSVTIAVPTPNLESEWDDAFNSLTHNAQGSIGNGNLYFMDSSCLGARSTESSSWQSEFAMDESLSAEFARPLSDVSSRNNVQIPSYDEVDQDSMPQVCAFPEDTTSGFNSGAESRALTIEIGNYTKDNIATPMSDLSTEVVEQTSCIIPSEDNIFMTEARNFLPSLIRRQVFSAIVSNLRLVRNHLLLEHSEWKMPYCWPITSTWFCRSSFHSVKTVTRETYSGSTSYFSRPNQLQKSHWPLQELKSGLGYQRTR